MPVNKLVIRRLPPSMSENEFLKQVSPLPEHDYFCFFEANSGLSAHSFSRAYINFLDSEDMSMFRERFDNYVFLDKDGHEYPAVVEQSLWHKSPKNGPFYRCAKDETGSPVEGSHVAEATEVAPIEQDPEFLRFIEKLQAQKKRPQHSPIQTLETNLNELTNSPSSTCASGLAAKEEQKTKTPLIGFVNQPRVTKPSPKKAK